MNYGVSFNRGDIVANCATDVRADFVRKVYSLFFLSLLVTVGVGALAVPYTQVIMSMWFVVIIAEIACLFGLMAAQRVSGLNVALLYLFSAIQGLILGPLLALYEARFPGLPAEAGWVTLAVFGGLTGYVFATKKDFSFLGGILWVGIIALMAAGIVSIFVHAAWLSIAYSVVGVLIFSGYVLYDTSQIMNRLSPQDAVVGAAMLYLDFVNLFLFILRLLSNRRD